MTATDRVRASAALRADNLYRFFHTDDEEIQALRGVTLDLCAGEFVVVRGPSGSGKSTLLSCLAGLDEPDGGVVRVGGVRISRRPERERAHVRATSIGVLMQSANLVPHLTLTQNVALVRRLAGSAPPSGFDPVDALGLGERRHALPATLSGGETVRAGLAVALANDPTVLLADEPTGELDSATERQVLQLLRRRTDAGLTVLVASHSAAVADIADRVLRLDDGVLA